MSKMCKKCNESYYGSGDCKCKPFKIYYPEYFGEDKEVYYGHDFEGVAEKFARNMNEEEDYRVNEYLFENPIEIENEEGEIKLYNVYAEPEINYYPKEIGRKELK